MTRKVSETMLPSRLAAVVGLGLLLLVGDDEDTKQS
jgi:hypothetical protein